MPLPTPKKYERKEKFISRCARNKTIDKEYKTRKQKLAVCYSQWEKDKKRR